jgi:hypothetical protein
MLGAQFVSALLSSWASGRELLAIYDRGNGPEAAAIVYETKPGIWSTFNPSESSFGMWVQQSDWDVRDLADQLIRKLPRLPLILAITQQDPKFLPRPADDRHLRTMDYIRTPWVVVDGDFEQYWAKRGKNLRTNMKKARAALAKAGIRPRLETLTAREQIMPALADYERLEASGWKAKAGTALKVNDPHGRFYATILEQAFDRGAGRIYRYAFDDRPVAMDLCINDGDSLVVLKTAYDESQAHASPASLMREEECRQLFVQAGVRRIEFYGPLMEWHTRWAQEDRRMYHINYYRHPVLCWLHQAVRRRMPEFTATKES